MTTDWSPTRWANDLSLLLNMVLGSDRFPVNVPEVAREYSKQRYPDDPIAVVKGDRLPGFDGALFRAPVGKKGWGIFFNNAITSKGRINYTLAHELGHYLLHRASHPDGIWCGDEDVVRWDSEYGQIEHQANVFAAWLLMPFDDYRCSRLSEYENSRSELNFTIEPYRPRGRFSVRPTGAGTNEGRANC